MTQLSKPAVPEPASSECDSANSRARRYALALAIVAACTAVNMALRPLLAQSNLTMVYLLGVVWCASKFGKGPSILASLCSVAAFDFFLVPPLYSFSVADAQYVPTLFTMLVIALLVSTLSARVREQSILASKMSEEAQFERLRNVLLSSVSHDVRTPLATITGAASSLLSSQAIRALPKESELSTVIYEEAERLESYVKNVLSMTRLQAGALQINRELQPLEEVVGAALTRMDEHIGSRRVHIDLPSDLPMVAIDAVLMEQVLFNLLENAVKYTSPDDQITIRAKRDERFVFVSVGDTGPGIARGDEERIFQKYFRSQDTDGGVFGAGLGLAICKGIVEAHQGKIWAEQMSAPGACITFRLPYERQENALAAKETPSR